MKKNILFIEPQTQKQFINSKDKAFHNLPTLSEDPFYRKGYYQCSEISIDDMNANQITLLNNLIKDINNSAHIYLIKGYDTDFYSLVVSLVSEGILPKKQLSIFKCSKKKALDYLNSKNIHIDQIFD
jgi:hypothetical protein